MNARRGDWIEVYSGRAFWPLDPRAHEVDVRDIAHALSLVCRFTGHVREFYSVAQHSVLVSRAVPERDALWGLLHDASEAYVADVSRPVKRLPEMTPYREAERRLMVVVCERFELPMVQPASVSEADMRILATEKRDLLRGPPWELGVEPYPEPIEPWSPEKSEYEFLSRFRALDAARRAA